MDQAIVIRDRGGPGVLNCERVTVGAPGKGQVWLRHTAIGINFHDCYVRSGLYTTLSLLGIPGLETVGVVDSVGPDVVDFSPGDRVGYITLEYGGYASARLMEASLLIRLPE